MKEKDKVNLFDVVPYISDHGENNLIELSGNGMNLVISYKVLKVFI